MKFYIVGIFLFLTSCLPVFGQQSEVYLNELKHFQEAIDLYEKNQFASAKTMFSEVATSTQKRQLKSQAKYYESLSSLKLNEPGAALIMEDFVRSHPTSNKRNEAFFELGDYYFLNGNNTASRRWFNQVDSYNLNKDYQNEFYFKFAYVSLKSDDLKKANSYFNRVKNDESYGQQAKYYLGYIAYAGDDYRKAQELFDEVEGDQQLNEDLAYFKSDMSFKAGNFEEAITSAKEKLQKANVQEQSQLNKIIGESYFNLQQYKEAIPYLQSYRGDRGKWSNTDHYQLGYAYFMQNDFENAAMEFSKIIGGKDKVAQNAYYHLAQSYLKNNAKSEALNAFKNVSEMDFDLNLQQDAFLNYAKLSYEIGNAYTSVAELLKEFLIKYPNAKEKDEIQNLLVGAYLNEKNYKDALLLLTNSRDFDDKKTLQQVAYLYATELFNSENYNESKMYHQKVINQPIDASLAAKSKFWLAEIDYINNNISEAIVGFKQFEGMPQAKSTTEYSDLYYNLGYAYFKNENYELAQTYFQNQLKLTNEPAFKHDLLVRLGDSYFASGDYWPAMETYNKALSMTNFKNDYPFYQKAISYGFVNRNEKKIEELQKFSTSFPNSPYRVGALYELGNTYVAEDNPQSAVKVYEQISLEYPNSALEPKALSKKGLIHYNANQYQKALATLQNLVSKYPKTEQAKQAINTVRLIYIDQGEPEKYASWVTNLEEMDVADSDIDNATFQAAENPFLEGKTDKAIAGFKKYLNQYPNGLHALKANFYLAQLLYNQGEKQESLGYYKMVLDASTSEFTETSLYRSAAIYLEKDEYKDAIPFLIELENNAQFTQNVVFAVSNLMKAYYHTQSFEKTISYANKVKELKSAEERALNDANLFSARAYMKLNQESKAEAAYAVVQQSASGILAAEAQYYKAYFLHKKQNYEASTEAVKELTKEYARFQEFGFKGLLIMAKNFFALGDAFNATYILESLETSASDFPAIVEEAKIQLDIMKRQIAEKNSSVDVDSTENN